MSSQKTHRKIFAVVALLAVFAALLVLSRPDAAGNTGWIRRVVFETAAPFQRAADRTASSVRGAWNRYILLVGLQEENRRLRERIAALERDLDAGEEIKNECTRLREMLSFKQKADYPVISGRVVGMRGGSLVKTVMVDRGTVQGVRVGMPVLGAAGLAGRVVEVSSNQSKVLLLTDFNSNIDCIIQPSRINGIVQGCGRDEYFRMKYVQRSVTVEVGQKIITSGLGGIFPKGIIVGRVIDVSRSSTDLFLTIWIEPAVDTTRLEEVMILFTARSSGS
ncbi:MAG: rod shape-determining protein MreC [Deltaproteobacteria bacterium]|nr:rod shape-determining protein MreC [Deltaproteobacteria bacterium]